MRRRIRREKPKAAPAPRIGSGPGTLLATGEPGVRVITKLPIFPDPLVVKTLETMVDCTGTVNSPESTIAFIDINGLGKPVRVDVTLVVPPAMGGIPATLEVVNAC